MQNQKISVSKTANTAMVNLNLGKTPIDEFVLTNIIQIIDSLESDPAVRAIVFEGFGSAPPSKIPIALLISKISKPTIASIRDDCFDHSLELAIACDIRIASDTAKFAMRHMLYGVLPYDGGTQRLPRLIGRSQSMFLLLTSEIISAKRALEIGLLQNIVPVNSLDTNVGKIAKAIAKGAPIAIAYTKEAISNSSEMTLSQGLSLEQDLGLLLFSTKDRKEGLKSFAEKRPPQFGGE